MTILKVVKHVKQVKHNITNVDHLLALENKHEEVESNTQSHKANMVTWSKRPHLKHQVE